MTTDSTTPKRAYASKIGLIADSPNFPSAWEQVMEKVKIADRLGYDFDLAGRVLGLRTLYLDG